ncbi:hypothetical protein BDA99DRAFT_512075 [Phascolomyces articulosus]|uniref:Uncharacterized protein n=1 Tax=Phascolomyces articulosus TaxID=60185 RepID=A0AAD5JZJ6_9FUNG|nr:hypothetical protein BDA99DRAFT_512075 [Phascolomyces articulosus]
MTSTDINTRQQQQHLYHHEKSKGMCELLVHSRTLPGGLVRRPVSFQHQYNNSNKNINNKNIIVKLTMALDGSLFLNQHMNHNNIVPSIQTMIQHYQQHMHQVSIVLDTLLAYQQKEKQHSHHHQSMKTTLVRHDHQTQIEIILPSSLFSPHPPSKGRAKMWLQSILDGMDPSSSSTAGAFVISEHDGDTQPIDPAYFRELQLFLDQVDSMIGSSFGMMQSSRRQKQQQIPSSSSSSTTTATTSTIS